MRKKIIMTHKKIHILSMKINLTMLCLIKGCWKRGVHESNTKIEPVQTTKNPKECRQLCRDTNSPKNCEYFSFNPGTHQCWLKTMSSSNNGMKATTDENKQWITGLKRCSNGKTLCFYTL